MLTEGTKTELTDMVIPELDALVVIAQVELEVMSQLTTLPLASAFVVKVGLLLPTFTAFTFH
jgi:hypothetical protein